MVPQSCILDQRNRGIYGTNASLSGLNIAINIRTEAARSPLVRRISKPPAPVIVMANSRSKYDTKPDRDDLRRPSSSEDSIPNEAMPFLQPRDTAATREVPSSVDNRTDKPSLFLAGLSTTRFWVIFSQILATQFICFFDTTIMASSHPVITSYFGTAHSASWLSTAFMVMSTVSQPFLGRLSDGFGRKPLFLSTLAVFSIATLWCSLATSIESLIAARAVCGVGAGGTLLMGSIIMSDMIPIEYVSGRPALCFNAQFGSMAPRD